VAYTVILTPQAERDLRGLDPQIGRRILPHLRALAENPRPPGCKFLKGSASGYRIRVGDWRVLYVVIDETRSVTVTNILHRSKAYD
jgi:mRNA interferase RelE/StbE